MIKIGDVVYVYKYHDNIYFDEYIPHEGDGIGIVLDVETKEYKWSDGDSNYIYFYKVALNKGITTFAESCYVERLDSETKWQSILKTLKK